MTTTLPLIRAAAIAPFLLWMRDHGIDAEARLRRAGLPPDLLTEPEHPIPLFSGVRLVVQAAQSDGPDIGWRAVSASSLGDIGILGHVVLGAPTPRQAILRAVAAYAHHGSHEQFSLAPAPGGAVVRHAFRVPLDDEALHVCHLYAAALVHVVIAGSDLRGCPVTRMEIRPHPICGLEHLRRHLDCDVVPAPGRTLALTVPDAVLDRPYARMRQGRPQTSFEDGWASIRGDGSLAGSIGTILPDLLADGTATVPVIAELAYMSRRTLQRRLTDEGSSLGRLIDETRHRIALSNLTTGDDRISDIAVQLGYTSTSSLSRAMRRWTDCSPSSRRLASRSLEASKAAAD